MTFYAWSDTRTTFRTFFFLEKFKPRTTHTLSTGERIESKTTLNLPEPVAMVRGEWPNSFFEGMKRFANLCRFSREHRYEGGVYIDDNAWNGFILFDANSLRRCVKVLPRNARSDIIVHDSIPNYFESDVDIARFLSPILEFSQQVQSTKSYRIFKHRKGTYDVVHVDGVRISQDDFASHMRTKHVLWVDAVAIGREYPPSQLEKEDRKRYPGILSDLLLFGFARTVWRAVDGSSLPLWAAALVSDPDGSAIDDVKCPLTMYTGLDHDRFVETEW